MNARLTNAPEITLSGPLSPRPNQTDRWRCFAHPQPFDAAAQAVLKAAHAQDGERSDVAVTDLRAWAFGSSDARQMELTRVPVAGRITGEPVALRENTFGQLCQKLSTPAPYIRTLPANLQVACMNYGLTQKRTPAPAAPGQGEVRAVLSDRYAAVDNHDLLDMVADCLDRTSLRQEARVGAVATGAHTVLRITLPNDGVPVCVGDVIEHGINLANSELGLRSVQVTPITYRLVCTNGMGSWKSEAAVRMRHVGDPDRLHAQPRDAIPVAFAAVRGGVQLSWGWIVWLMTLGDRVAARLGVAAAIASSAGWPLLRSWHHHPHCRSVRQMSGSTLLALGTS
ncbi:MAG: DUF932 domain-containing protein [Myxococcales bacterium]|nr:DUF932 domain-containing protein [Myxococcales bacterium]